MEKAEIEITKVETERKWYKRLECVVWVLYMSIAFFVLLIGILFNK